MNRPTRYKILRADSISDLIDQVDEHIKVGWIPQGGIAISPDKFFYQAMCAYNKLGPYITRTTDQHPHDGMRSDDGGETWEPV